MLYDYKKVNKFRKLARFYTLYGLNRTYVKTAGRFRGGLFFLKLPLYFYRRKAKNVGIIGSGHFAFSSIAYFLKINRGNVIYGVFDINYENATTLANYYNCKVFESASRLLEDKNIRYVYIASNHSSHTDYAIKALEKNKIVFIEKPISTNKEQLKKLLLASKNKTFFVGYNRPFSPAIQLLRENIIKTKKREPLTLNCFITGHKIPEDHWYRNYAEGTRVCGNIGHWLDLSIHLLNHIGLPKELNVSVRAGSNLERDDNLNITISSDLGDIVSIMLSSREEPFEGINETINFQHSHVIAKIDDFRHLTIWKGDKLIKKRFFRKDVGHNNSIMQPFDDKIFRNFNEVIVSTKLMLEITEMIRENKIDFVFKI